MVRLRGSRRRLAGTPPLPPAQPPPPPLPGFKGFYNKEVRPEVLTRRSVEGIHLEVSVGVCLRGEGHLAWVLLAAGFWVGGCMAAG